MNRSKKFTVLLLGIVSVLCFLFAVGCNGAPTPEATDWVYEYMTDVEIPFVSFDGSTEADALNGNIKYKFTSPEYTVGSEKKQDVYESDFPSVFCDRIGTWTVTYTFGKQSVIKTFEVKDTTAPVIEIPEPAYDVYVGETGSLPRATVSDISGVNASSRTDKIVLTATDGTVSELEVKNKRYTPDKTGKITYTVSVEDIYGNKAETTACWNVKDAYWRDSYCSAEGNGYLATFDKPEYVNSASSGDMAAYWNDTVLTETWHEAFEGATGVLEVTAPPNDYGQAAFKFQLSDYATKNDLANKYLVIKIYTPNNVDYLRFGCKTWQSVAGFNDVEAVHNFRIAVTPNEWNVITIPTAELLYGYFIGGENKLDVIQFAFGEYQSGVNMSGNCTLYIDNVTLATQMSEVTGLKLDGSVLTWSEVTGATGYKVNEDGVETVVKTCSYTVKDILAPLSVKAVTDNVLYTEAATATPFLSTADLGADDLASFNAKAYESVALVNTYNTARTAASLKAEYLASYKNETGVLKVTTVNNASGIGDVVINLPKSSTGGMTIRYMIEKSDSAYKRFLQPNSEYGFDDVADLTVTSEWKTVYLDYTKQYAVEKNYNLITVLLQGGTEGEENVVYFAFVKDGNCIAALNSSELIEALPTGYIANFNDERYLDLVSFEGSGTYDKSIATIDGVTALKISVSDAQTAWSKVYINLFSTLPKNYSVKIYFEEVGTNGLANYFRFNNVAGTISSDNEIDANNYKGSWQTFNLTMQDSVTDKKTYNFQLINTNAACSMNIYVVAIYDTASVSD